MARVVCLAVALCVAGCGSSGEAGGTPWDESTGGTGSGRTETGDSIASTAPDPDDTNPTDDETGDGTTGGGTDCSPAWTSTWVGSPCASDADCSFPGGSCLPEADGFPCGTCSTACDQLCEDLDGAPETFCVDGSDVGIEATGHCLSKCDPGIVGGNGCRDGYGCTVLSRFNEPGTSSGVCVPLEFAGDGDTPCQSMLLELGAVFAPSDHAPDSPPGFPGLTCDIEDPVFLYSPVNGVAIRYVSSAEDAEVLVSCQTAVSIVGSAAVAQSLGANELIHIGTYVCKVIGDGPNISQHGLGQAIDIAGFTLDDGSEVTVFDHWEDGNPNPTTELGILLRSFTDQVWGMNLWNIILTPEYNADHNDHFHVDLTPGGNTYE